MTIYIVFSAAVTALIYFNVFGLFMGIKEVPPGIYRDTLWKYKKMEIVEKGVICVLFAVVIISMYFTDETAAIALGAMAVMMPLEYFFGRYIRRSLVCPECGGPVWTGNFIVVIKPRRACAHCGKPFYDLPAEREETSENEEEQ